MTRRDKWLKRPCVLRYREYCDRLRAAAPPLLEKLDVFAIDLIVHVAMPGSWSAKKKDQLDGKMHRQRMDADNLVKAAMDALFKEDSGIADERCRKFWCREGRQRSEVKLWFL